MFYYFYFTETAVVWFHRRLYLVLLRVNIIHFMIYLAKRLKIR